MIIPQLILGCCLYLIDMCDLDIQHKFIRDVVTLSLESERNYNHIASNDILFCIFHKLVRKMNNLKGEDFKDTKAMFEQIMELMLDSPNGKTVNACFDIYFRSLEVSNVQNKSIREGVMAMMDQVNQKYFSNYFELSNFYGKNNNYFFLPKVDLYDVRYEKTIDIKLKPFNFMIWIKNPEYNSFTKEFTIFSAAYIVNGINTWKIEVTATRNEVKLNFYSMKDGSRVRKTETVYESNIGEQIFDFSRPTRISICLKPDINSVSIYRNSSLLNCLIIKGLSRLGNSQVKGNKKNSQIRMVAGFGYKSSQCSKIYNPNKINCMIIGEAIISKGQLGLQDIQSSYVFSHPEKKSSLNWLE